jgi:hypothetical protein
MATADQRPEASSTSVRCMARGGMGGAAHAVADAARPWPRERPWGERRSAGIRPWNPLEQANLHGSSSTQGARAELQLVQKARGATESLQASWSAVDLGSSGRCAAAEGLQAELPLGSATPGSGVAGSLSSLAADTRGWRRSRRRAREG